MTLDEMFDLLASRGSERYGDEPVSQLQHALQCAALAERTTSSDALVTAALMHDIGHLIVDDEDAAHRGEDLRHEDIGADALDGLFGAEASVPVRLHVAAKRYLCAVDSGYRRRLSEASIHSLELQGGTFDEAGADAFSKADFARDAIALRRWDDAAKDPKATTPDLAYYRVRAERALLRT